MSRRNMRPEQHTPQELDRLAEVMPGDVDRAMATWRQDAPPLYRNLLDAEPTEQEEPDGAPAQ